MMGSVSYGESYNGMLVMSNRVSVNFCAMNLIIVWFSPIFVLWLM